MNLQTKLSSLLFVILGLLATGSATILREELSRSAGAQGEQLAVLAERLHEADGQTRALLAARSMRALIDAELGEVSARAEISASSPLASEALQGRNPEVIKQVNAWLESSRGPLRFHRLLDARGYVVSSQPENPSDAMRNFSLLDPPSVQTSVPLQALMNAVLDGRAVASIETFSTDLLTFLTLEAAGKRQATSDAVLLLLAIHPVTGSDGKVLGAVASGLDLTTDERMFARWRTNHEDSGMSLALLNGPRRVQVQGSALEKGSTLDEGRWKVLSTQEEVSEMLSGAQVARVALRSESGQTVGALEVQLPPPLLSSSAREMAQLDGQRHEQLFQHGLGLMGMLGVLTLAIGILVSRSLLAPLRKLAKKAESASAGKLDTSFAELLGTDEVGSLARSFDRMRVSVRKLLERHSSEAGRES